MSEQGPPGIPGTHVFKNEPDARQSDRIDHPVSRFRPTYRALTNAEKALHDEIKTKATELEALFREANKSEYGYVNHDKVRYLDLAVTSLEQSVMWAVKGLTS